MLVSGVLDFEQESFKTHILHFDINCFGFFATYTFDTADMIPISDIMVNTNILSLAKSYLLLQQIIGILHWLDFVCTVNRRCEI
jgi:hypothetical protein